MAAVERDFGHLFASWFNRGFLSLQRIELVDAGDILEKIIRYEAVHEITNWDDLRLRLEPPDRRCYAFFHPALSGEPLIFVEVAPRKKYLRRSHRLGSARVTVTPAAPYRRLQFDFEPPARRARHLDRHLLIKQVAEDQARAAALNNFVTWSPLRLRPTARDERG